MTDRTWWWIAAAGAALLFVGSPAVVMELPWTDAGWWLLFASPAIALGTALAAWRARRKSPWGSPTEGIRSVLLLALVAGTAWSATLTWAPALAEALGHRNHMFSDWETNDPTGWLVVGVIYGAMAAWGAFVTPRPTSARSSRLAWLAAGLAIHAVLLVAVLPRIAPNETQLAFASLYVVPLTAMLLLMEPDWRRLFRLRPDPE